MTMAEDVANCVSGWFWEGVPGAEPTAPGHPPGLLQGPTQEKKQSNNTQQLHFSQRRIASRRATRNYIISKPVMFRNIEQSADVPRATKKRDSPSSLIHVLIQIARCVRCHAYLRTSLFRVSCGIVATLLLF